MRTTILLALGPFLAGCSPAPSEVTPRRPLERACWVWGRGDAPSFAECQALADAKITRVYWQVAEVSHHSGAVRDMATFPMPDTLEEKGIECIPVFRIDPKTRLPEDLPGAAMGAALNARGMSDEVQFDYDCPDRLLPAYAKWLRDVRAASGLNRITTTALAGWARVPGWGEVEQAVDAAYPMLYDALPERTFKPDGTPDAVPLVDEAYVTGLLSDWSKQCHRFPWHAGLPNFTRLSLFRKGMPLGQIRSWTWEALNDPEAWEAVAPTGAEPPPPGVTFLRARRAMTLGGIAIQADDQLAVKQCEAESLRKILAELPQSTAQGVVWFQMSRPGLASNGWSLPMLASGFSAPPQPRLRRDGAVLMLENAGSGDIPPQPPLGQTLRLAVAAGSLREVLPGEFTAVETRREGRPVPAAFATEIVLRFPRLPAGATLRSGALVPASGSNIPLVQAATLNDAPIALVP